MRPTDGVYAPAQSDPTTNTHKPNNASSQASKMASSLRPSWSSTSSEQFSAMEVQRMKLKAEKLRGSRKYSSRLVNLPPTPTSAPASSTDESSSTFSEREMAIAMRRSRLKEWNSDLNSQQSSLTEVLGSRQTPTSQLIQEQMLKGFHTPSSKKGVSTPKTPRTATPDSHSVRSTPSTPYFRSLPDEIPSTHSQDDSQTTSAPSSEVPNDGLHELVGEAQDVDDIAWRNALYILAEEPQRAQVADEHGWTPLHLACLTGTPPPWMLASLLRCGSPLLLDQGGRTCLHLLAASSTDAQLLQMVVQAAPFALTMRDAHGRTPLQLAISNASVPLALDVVQVLSQIPLEYNNNSDDATNTASNNNDKSRQVKLQRRGQHLNLSLEELASWQEPTQPVTKLRQTFLDQELVDDWESYPPDVQMSLKKIARLPTQSSTSPQSWNNQASQNPAGMCTPDTKETPLHLVLRRSLDEQQQQQGQVDEESPAPPGIPDLLGIVKHFVHAEPAVLTWTDTQGLTPLWLVLQSLQPSLPMVTLTSPAAHVAFEGQLPLHWVAQEWPHDLELLQVIKQAYPSAVLATNDWGNTPLHLLLRNLQGLPAPAHLQVVMDSRIGPNRQGETPLDLLVKTKWPRSYPPSTIYQKLFRQASSCDWRELGHLPRWLKEMACTNRTMCRDLSEELAGPLKFAWICLDGILLAVLLVVFRIQMDDFVRRRTLELWCTLVVYGTSCGRLLPLVLRGFLGDALGLGYLLDLTAMVLAVLSSVFMVAGDVVTTDTMITLGTTTTILLWCAVLGYVQRWSLGCAVFGGIVKELARALVWPVAILCAVVVASTQVIFTNDGSIQESYRQVWEALYQAPTSEPWIAVWLVALVLVGLGVVGTIVVVASRLDWEDLGRRYYWRPKLDFLLATRRIGCWSCRCSSIEESSCNSRAAHYWDELVTAAFGEPQYWESSKKDRMGCCGKLQAVVIAVVWGLLGCVTLGLAWPPQIRRLLVPSVRLWGKEDEETALVNNLENVKDLLQLAMKEE